MDRLTDVSFVKVLFENGLIDFIIFSWDVLITMIRPSHGYRLVNKMSFSRDVSITMIRPSHGYRLVNEMSLLSSLSFKKVTLTKLVNVNVHTVLRKRCFGYHDTPLTRVLIGK